MAPTIFVWQGDWQGGAERITLEAAHFFAQQGMEVTLGVYKKDPEISLPQIVHVVPHWVPSSFKALYASVFSYKGSQNFAVAYSHTLGHWKRYAPLVVIHDAADLDTYHRPYGTPMRWLASVLWRWLYLDICLAKATIIFSATDAFTDYLRRHHVTQPRIIQSASFYHESIFHYTPRTPPQKLLRIIFIGNYNDPRKNFKFIERELGENPTIEIHVVGGRVKRTYGNRHFWGYLSPNDLVQQLMMAHIFVLPSQAEGFSIALLEALATGIPCLVQKKSAPLELHDIKNLVTFTRATFQERLHDIRKNYTAYAIADPRIKRFARSSVLNNEYLALRELL